MICRFRNYAASILIFVLLVTISCSSGSGRVRAVPSDGEYELCPVCKGSGSLETYSHKPPQKGLELNEKEKGCADSIGCIALFGGLLLNDDPREPEFDDTGRLKERYDSPDRSPDDDKPYDYVDRSYVRHKVRCERCDGIGWIKKDESSTWSMGSEQTTEGFKRANELLNSGNRK